MLCLADIVDRDVISLPPDMSLEDAAGLLARHRLDAAPVVQHGRVLGLLTQHGIRRLIGQQPLRVADMRFAEYHALPPETELPEALAYARSAGADHVLVLDQGKLIGVVSTTRIRSSLPASNGSKDGSARYIRRLATSHSY